jgi:FdhD protein
MRLGFLISMATCSFFAKTFGRHNAVDKAIGRAFLDGLLPLRNHIMVVSGQILRSEIMQKGLAAGVSIVAAVSGALLLLR